MTKNGQRNKLNQTCHALALLFLAGLSFMPAHAQMSYQSISPDPRAAFDSVLWRHANKYSSRRTTMLSDLLARHKSVRMTRGRLYKLLGVPDESFHAYAAYDLPTPGAYDCAMYLEFAFVRNRVTKFRVRNRLNLLKVVSDPNEERVELDHWADSPRASVLDAKEIAMQRPRKLRPGSTVIAVRQPDDELLHRAYESPRAVAVQLYSQFLQRFPDELWVWAMNASLHEQMGNHAAAIYDYTKTIDLAGGMATQGGWELRALVYLKVGMYGEVVRDCTDALAVLCPADGSEPPMAEKLGATAYRGRCERLYQCRATAYVRLRRFSEALSDLNSAIALHLDDKKGYERHVIPASLYQLRSESYRALKESDKADEDDVRAKQSEEEDAEWCRRLKTVDQQ